MQDRSPPARQSSLAMHGLTIHLGQEQTRRGQTVMSALTPKADSAKDHWDVRFGPTQAPMSVMVDFMPEG
jgi:hypothetical protein